MREALKDLRQQAIETNLALTSIALSSAATAASLDALRNSTNANAAATVAASTAAQGGGFAFLGMSGAVLAVVVAVSSLSILLSPFIATVVAATVIVTAFAVGVTAVTTALGLAFFPLAAFTAGVIMLADRMFTTGQTLVDPLAKVEKSLTNVADNLGKLVMPWALRFTDWMNGAVVALAPLTYQLAYWFGGQLPIILQIASQALQVFTDAMRALASIFNSFFTGMAANLPTFQGFFAQLVSVGVQAVQGLLTNLLALSDWFLARLPAMAPIVAATMGGIGSSIQGMGKVFGDVVDFFIKNWPAISNAATQAWQQIVAGWNFVAPILGPVAQQVLHDLIALFDTGAQRADALKGVMFALGVVAAGLAIILLTVVEAAIAIADTLIQLVRAIQSVATWFHNAADAVGRFLSLLQQADAIARGFRPPSLSAPPPAGPGGPNPGTGGSNDSGGGGGGAPIATASPWRGRGAVNATFYITAPDAGAAGDAVYRSLTRLLS